MANDAHEEFWGCTLTKGKSEYMWDPTVESEDDVEHKLQVTSVCLGSKVKDGERNLVEFTTEDNDGKQITCSLVSLRAGGVECLHIELGFNNPTKFKLKEGSGPISLCGVHLQAVPLDFDEESNDDSDEDIPDLVKPKKQNIPQPKIETKNKDKSPVKRKADKNTEEKPAIKKKKPEPEPESEEDDESEDEEGEEDEEDQSEDEEMPSLLDGEAEEGSEESEDEDEPEVGDDVDDDEDEDEDDDDDEDDEDDEDEDESEEEEEVKPKKKMMNGNAKNKKPEQNGKTPQKKKEAATPKSAGPKKDPVTPKSAGPKKTPEEIKGMLKKSPNIPKSFPKFANFLRNNLKVTDDSTHKEFWEYVQKTRK